jgi:hypothetical protein
MIGLTVILSVALVPFSFKGYRVIHEMQANKPEGYDWPGSQYLPVLAYSTILWSVAQCFVRYYGYYLMLPLCKEKNDEKLI